MSTAFSARSTNRIVWWQPAGALDRYLADLLNAEAQVLRPGGPWPPHAAYRPHITLGEDGLGFDSLERLALAAALSEALHLHRGGLDGTLVVTQRLEQWRDATAAALDGFSGSLCFRSSGSTGARRRCVHVAAALDAEAAFFASQLSDRRRVVVMVPAHHIYGFLFTLLLPALFDLPVVDLRGRFPGAVVAALRPGDLVVGHPGCWAEMCRAAPDGWPTDVVGVSSGAPCPIDTAAAAARAGLSRLLQVYGASETGGIGWRDDPAAPYRLLPFWQPVDESTKLQRGEAAAVEAPDQLHWHGTDHFTLHGRRDAAVQVGGINVHTERVRTVLRAHPGVADAAVRLMAPHEGTRLKAFIVPHEGAASPKALRRDLYRHVKAKLGVAERPKAFSFGLALPRTSAGKPADWQLPMNEGSDRTEWTVEPHDRQVEEGCERNP